MQDKVSINEIRDLMIRQLASAKSEGLFRRQHSSDLYNLDLTMYSDKCDIKSIVYNVITKSILDNRVSLHPEQVRMLEAIEKNSAVILSAPTSFGKTFVAFEYMAKHKPATVMLIVPTLALVDEYRRKILKDYKDTFAEYKMFQTIDEKIDYSKFDKKVFILTHDKIIESVNNDTFKIFNIDYLVIDEIYKLSSTHSESVNNTDDRILVLNFAYFKLAGISKKYVLLAPFIRNVTNKDKLNKQPIVVHSTYSPVVNDIIKIEIMNDSLDSRFQRINELVSSDRINPNSKTMIYIPNPTDAPKYVNTLTNDFTIERDWVINFIDWASNEIHPLWYLIKAMKHGYLIHNGSLSTGMRKIQLSLFDASDSGFNRIICNSALLEGVNTSTENIIIAKPCRYMRNDITDKRFSAFDFFNLVGRSGRLFKCFIGKAFYIKSKNDPDFEKEQAYNDIEFMLTQDLLDINIKLDEIVDDEEFQAFLNKLGITKDEYNKNIGFMAFNNVKALYERFKAQQESLLIILKQFETDMTKISRATLVRKILEIIKGYSGFTINTESNLINLLINKKRLSIKQALDEYTVFLENKKQSYNINALISTCLKLKNGEIENSFYKNSNVILLFLQCSKVDGKLIEIFKQQIIDTIDYIYFKGVPYAKELLEMGIYYKDVDKITTLIKDVQMDTGTLTRFLKHEEPNMKITFLSRYIIKNL